MSALVLELAPIDSVIDSLAGVLELSPALGGLVPKRGVNVFTTSGPSSGIGCALPLPRSESFRFSEFPLTPRLPLPLSELNIVVGESVRTVPSCDSSSRVLKPSVMIAKEDTVRSTISRGTCLRVVIVDPATPITRCEASVIERLTFLKTSCVRRAPCWAAFLAGVTPVTFPAFSPCSSSTSSSQRLPLVRANVHRSEANHKPTHTVKADDQN